MVNLIWKPGADQTRGLNHVVRSGDLFSTTTCMAVDHFALTESNNAVNLGEETTSFTNQAAKQASLH